jgi:hypothetical protein|tara:strand:+ start:18313 stop:21612 length:3300 start_codon:yes stop_codon:yes gene_type:complete
MIKKLLLQLTISITSICAYAQNPGLVISEVFVNPAGTDSPYEWVELVATQNIDFSVTPYSVIVSNNGNASVQGWIAGGSLTYGFSINSGVVSIGDVVYVGGSLMAPLGQQLRSINTLTTNGDSFGNSGSGPFGNGGGNADGIAVFNLPIANLTSSSIPTDAIFYGTGIGGAAINSTDGYQLPINDLYAGGKLSSTDYFAPEAGSTYLKATGTYNIVSDSWVGTRAFTIDANFTDDSTEINLVTINPPGFVSISNTVQIVDETSGTVNINVDFTNANTSDAKIIFGLSIWSNSTVVEDYIISNDTLIIPASQNGTFSFPIQIIDDAISEKTERLILKVINTVNCSVQGNDYQIIFIKDNDYVAPIASNQLKMNLLTSFSNGAGGSNSAEIVAYDSLSQRLFIVNSVGGKIDIVDLSNPSAPVLLSSIDINLLGGINSIATHNGLVVAAIEGVNPQDLGKVYFFDTAGTILNNVTVGAMPDMITFNKDFTKVLTANEGEPSADYLNDPEGSVSIIDLTPGISALTNANVTTATFTSFNGQDSLLKAQGIRLFPQAASVAQDLEPEYIAISDDNTKAYVSIQEHNAMAVIDIATGTVLELRALGLSDYSFGNALDPSDQSGDILIQSLPVKGAYMPDAISFDKINGIGYVFSANEGDARENNLIEDADRIGGMALDSAAFPDQHILKNNKFMGRLNALQVTGDTDNDGDFDELHTLGGRSFSIWDAATGNLVFDSKDMIEQIISHDTNFVALFNASNGGSSTSKNRSDDKGPEPEGVTNAVIDGNHYLFVGLERIGGAMVFNVNNPSAPIFVGYYNNRDVATNGPDRGSEGILFISKEQSPNGKPLLLLANEVSSTVSIFEINTCLELSGSDAIQGDLSFCEGTSTDLFVNANSGVTLQWLNGNQAIASATDTLVTIANAGMYSVSTINSIEACSDTSTSVLVVENLNPIVDLGNDTTTCINLSPITLSFTAGFESYLWSTGDTTNSIIVSNSGNYSLAVVDTNNCSGMNSILVTFDPCLGLEETEIQAKVYPNPFNGTVNIKTASKSPSHISVCNSTGYYILENLELIGDGTLDLSHYSNGIYFMSIFQDGKLTWHKLEKQ